MGEGEQAFQQGEPREVQGQWRAAKCKQPPPGMEEGQTSEAQKVVDTQQLHFVFTREGCASTLTSVGYPQVPRLQCTRGVSH